MGEAISFDRFLDLNYLDEADVFKIKDIDESTSKLLEEYKKNRYKSNSSKFWFRKGFEYL